jgi:hypothetical protein
MKKMFLVAVMALGTASVFASSQPVQKNSVLEGKPSNTFIINQIHI